MPRIFRHYVSYHLLALLSTDAFVAFASILAGLHLEGFGPGPVTDGLFVLKALTGTLLVMMVFHLSQRYDTHRVYGRRELALRLLLGLGAAYVLIAALGYPGSALRMGPTAYTLSFVFSFVGILTVQLLYSQVNPHSRNRRRLLLLGSGRPAQVIADTVNGSNPTYEMLGCIDALSHPAGEAPRGVKMLGRVEDLPSVSRATRPDVIVVALTERRRSLPLPAILECKFQGIEVEDWPTFYEKLTGKILLTDLRPSWLIFSEGFSTNNATVVVKRWIDVTFSALTILMTLPLWPLLALAIRLESPGPVFYRQSRIGKGGKVFSLIKFRSMRQDAEVGTGPVWATENDPRITRVGRFLRRSRLDELPQLVNVIAGHMSLVGPRPERPSFVSELQEQIPFYINRLAVKPGVTGWAQVKYHYGSTVEDAIEKLQYDFYYIKNMSIFLDLLILLQTVQVVLFARGSR